MSNKLTKLPNNIISGDTPLLQFPLTVSGQPANLTGYKCTFTATAAQTPTSSDVPVIQISVTGDATGVLNFQLLNNQPSNATANLQAGTTYYWDVQLNNQQAGSNLRIFTPLRGTFGVDTDYNKSIA